MTVSLALLAAHLLGDFPLQPDWIAKHKTESNTRLYLHVMVHAFLVMPIAWYLYPESPTQQFVFVMWIAGTHLTIDFRRWFEPKDGWGHDGMAWVWLNDQILHITALAFAVPVSELGLWA